MRALLVLAISLATTAAFAPGITPSHRSLRQPARTVAPLALLDLFKKKPKKEEGALTTGVSIMPKPS